MRKAEVRIYAERSSDAPLITDIVQRAYAAVPHSDHREHLMVEKLRRTDAFLPSLSLLAEVEGDPAGHVLLTKAKICSVNAVTQTLALAPLSVAPEHQRRGVGRSLIVAAGRQAQDLGFETIIVVGMPDYYAQAGFESLDLYSIRLPFSAPHGSGSILRLTKEAWQQIEGVVEYAPGWLDH